MKSYCEFIRKQKSIQLEFLGSGILVELFGKDCNIILGDCIYIGNIGVSTSAFATPVHINDSVIRFVNLEFCYETRILSLNNFSNNLLKFLKL